MEKKKPREIHANNAKVSPDSKIDPKYITNTVTMSGRRDHERPVVEDSDVAYARKFSEENKK